MNRYLLDTNLLVSSIRDDERWASVCGLYDIGGNNNFISVVSLGELWSLSIRNSWGQKRLDKLRQLDQSFIVIDINIEAVIYRYAEIDAFSQGKLIDRPLGTSSRNMGKNDLWIAATSSAFQLTLLTTDHDFDHLASSFLSLQTV